MNVFVSEFIGTAILLLLGNGVVANVILKKTYGNNGSIMANPNWAYSWIPVVGPIVGGLLAVVIFKLIQ